MLVPLHVLHHRRLHQLCAHMQQQPAASHAPSLAPPPPVHDPALPPNQAERDAAMLGHFKTFGFFVLRSVFDPQQMRRFSDAFNAGFDRMCGPFDKRVPGQRGASERNQMAYPGLQLDPIFAHEFLDDPAVLHACRLFLGDGCILVASDAQRIEAETHWHADTPPEVDYQMMKCIMYLDEHGDGCGSVALLPGSHHYEFACRAVETAPSMREKLPGAVTACTHPGDIVYFNQRLLHSSWGGQSGRRFLGLTLGEAPLTAAHIAHMEDHGRRWSQLCMNDRKSQVPDAVVQGAGPGRRRLIDWLLKHGF